MSPPTLRRIQRLVRREALSLSGHVLDKLAAGEFDLECIEHSILNGAIRNVERDAAGAAVDGNVYVIVGPDPGGLAFQTVGKIVKDADGNAYFLITACKEI